MNTIVDIQNVQATGPQAKASDPKQTLEPEVGLPSGAESEASVKDSLAETGLHPSSPSPKGGQRYLDPEQMSEFVTRVAEAIRKASVEPHVVGFKPDPDSDGYLIEIRKADGTLITSFTPEKVLNLHGNPDDLSGMVIDLKT